MRYLVSEAFYNSVSALVGLALQNENPLEYELAVDLIRDLITEGDE